MSNTAYMVNGFDVARTGQLKDQRLKSIVERRANALGPGYKLFYRAPVELVRGEGVYVYDNDGNSYLDAYNNVPSVGHCHPHVTAAIAAQAAVLNTHTRYASSQLVDYAERLLGTYPDEIANVMFTCTGSEAVDLALRIARFFTGGTGVVVTENAYHGLTTAAAEISPQLGPNVPIGTHVWTVPAPRPDRADGADVGEAFAADIRTAVTDMQRHGVRFAAFIADTLFSTDGILPEPAGFLTRAVEEVHAGGGLYIADEVQPGFGRTGERMWGFQRHGIVPDLVVMGKPMGNGMPIAGVAARPELLSEFGTKVRYFNTFGGNSVSIAAANAVLDVIENENLVQNCRDVGAYLKAGITELAQHDDVLAGIRGSGLYIAVDVVDPGTGDPDADRTMQLVNGLRERRVLISATGKSASTLKIRPPLPFASNHADIFLQEFSAALTDLRSR
ncbi:aspartate aminotransferase family protein [Mycolicibacterium sp. HK-90]|uniref:aspartate aminotransferase family protein n=1 Tax=Mycolicibacterium sp. HK-90 TaxID=3056937 RepID=UPI00265A2481|nr:aspartate aminotransferase family protein [Mycolicibacterium sp. HK-90]WKG03966.1 aspartate aminotransferase family protein [Mycolicibacterium sp. HK-90]